MEITLQSEAHMEATLETATLAPRIDLGPAFNRITEEDIAEIAKEVKRELGINSKSEFERDNVEAEVRLKSLEALETKCNWSSPCPTQEEREARKRWKWLMDRQSEFEEKWNL